MLADYARTDGHRLRRVEPVAQATRELAALVRARTALVEARRYDFGWCVYGPYVRPGDNTSTPCPPDALNTAANIIKRLPG